MDKTSYIAGLLYFSTEDKKVQEKAVQLLNGEITLKEAETCCYTKKFVAMAKRNMKQEGNASHCLPVEILNFIEEHLYLYQ